ncbi:MAG: hypothetical protein ACLTJ7_07795, partial [Clostridium sp.]
PGGDHQRRTACKSRRNQRRTEMMTLPIGYYFERFLNWLVTHCADFTRWCSANIDACVDWLRNLFCAPPEWVMMLIFAAMIYVISKRKLLTAGAIAGMYVIEVISK